MQGTLDEYCTIIRGHSLTDQIKIDVFRFADSEFITLYLMGDPVIKQNDPKCLEWDIYFEEVDFILESLFKSEEVWNTINQIRNDPQLLRNYSHDDVLFWLLEFAHLNPPEKVMFCKPGEECHTRQGESMHQRFKGALSGFHTLVRRFEEDTLTSDSFDMELDNLLSKYTNLILYNACNY